MIGKKNEGQLIPNERSGGKKGRSNEEAELGFGWLTLWGTDLPHHEIIRVTLSSLLASWNQTKRLLFFLAFLLATNWIIASLFLTTRTPCDTIESKYGQMWWEKDGVDCITVILIGSRLYDDETCRCTILRMRMGSSARIIKCKISLLQIEEDWTRHHHPDFFFLPSLYPPHHYHGLFIILGLLPDFKSYAVFFELHNTKFFHAWSTLADRPVTELFLFPISHHVHHSEHWRDLILEPAFSVFCNTTIISGWYHASFLEPARTEESSCCVM